MGNNKHLTLDDRITIQHMLESKDCFNAIAKTLGKNLTTVSREVKSRSVSVKSGAKANYKPFNECRNRHDCSVSKLCSPCSNARNLRKCRGCKICNFKCPDFVKDECKRLQKPPYVCNGCGNIAFCTLEKKLYQAEVAHNKYKEVLSETRSGTSFSEEEIAELNRIITPLIKQSQSPHHICVSNKDSIMVSESTIYRLVDSQLISAKNIDLPRKVRYRRRKKTVTMKVDKGCRIGRSISCFEAYMSEHPDTPIVQIDSVEGKKGGKVLLTIHFVKAEMMLAFLRDHNDSKSVTEIFNMLADGLGQDKFKTIFPVILADNGSEFSNPGAIEFDGNGVRRSHVFYCDPQASWQKGSAERNHEFIRCFIPKGVDMALYTQDDINTMMNHINSYSRESLGNKCPYDMFKFIYGNDLLDLLHCETIPTRMVTLNKSVFSKGVHYEIP